MVEPLVTIIVPVYNSEEYLRACVESILHQTYQNMEILLIDDGSKDDSLAMCRQLALEDERIRVISKPNEGICATRNRGLDEAQGDWIAFCDNDDKCENEEIRLTVEAALLNHVDVVRFQRRREILNYGRLVGVEEGASFEARRFSIDSMQAYMDGLCCGYGVWTGLYRRAFLDAHSIRFDTSIRYGFEDHLFITTILSERPSVYVMPQSFYVWYQRIEHSTSAKREKEQVSNRLDALVKWYDVEKSVAVLFNSEACLLRRRAFILTFARAELQQANMSRLEAAKALSAFIRKIEMTVPYKTFKVIGKDNLKVAVIAAISYYCPIAGVLKS